jgi:hypothetical protein
VALKEWLQEFNSGPYSGAVVFQYTDQNASSGCRWNIAGVIGDALVYPVYSADGACCAHCCFLHRSASVRTLTRTAAHTPLCACAPARCLLSVCCASDCCSGCATVDQRATDTACAARSAPVLCAADCAAFDKVTVQWYIRQDATSDTGVATLNLECSKAAGRYLRGNVE